MSSKPVFVKLKPKKFNENYFPRRKDENISDIKFSMEKQPTKSQLLPSQKINREFLLKASPKDKKVSWLDHSTTYI